MLLLLYGFLLYICYRYNRTISKKYDNDRKVNINGNDTKNALLQHTKLPNDMINIIGNMIHHIHINGKINPQLYDHLVKNPNEKNMCKLKLKGHDLNYMDYILRFHNITYSLVYIEPAPIVMIIHGHYRDFINILKYEYIDEMYE
jgi:hypothetical protein